MAQPRQLPLNVRLNDEATFDNFWVGQQTANLQVTSALHTLSSARPEEHFIYLWGRSGVGLSHLLQAACHHAEAVGLRCQYLPLQELVALDPRGVLEDLEQLDLLCLDDLQAVVGRSDWDTALFHLYNRMREAGKCLLVAARCAPRELATSLADLQSRLAWGTVYRLEALDDGDKQQALQWRARKRGMEMSDEVAQYILLRGSREPRELFACLDRLDRLSLVEKRRLTIPFVREVLGVG
jgi:DnaA family protein